MAHSKFNVDGPALEDSTQVIRPDHIMPVQEEEEVVEASVDTQILQKPPGLPALQEEQGGQAAETPENLILKCIMEDAGDPLHAFREYEHYIYSLVANSESDSEVPEDDDDEMEDTSSDEDELVPMNSQEESEDPPEGDHDQTSPLIIPVEDVCSGVCGEDELIPVNLQEESEDPPAQGDHDQTSPVIISVEDAIDIEGNETGPMNLHFTEVNVQGTGPGDPSTSRRLDFNIVTFDSVYPEADQLDVKVQTTLTTTSAAEGESISSNQILKDIHVDDKRN